MALPKPEYDVPDKPLQVGDDLLLVRLREFHPEQDPCHDTAKRPGKLRASPAVRGQPALGASVGTDDDAPLQA